MKDRNQQTYFSGAFSPHQAGFVAEGTETGTPFPEVNLLEKVRTWRNSLCFLRISE